MLETYNVDENPALCLTLIHNNLTSHRSLAVYEALRKRGHCIVFRPLYRPQDGPVEYTINQVCINLTKNWSEVYDLETIQTIVEEIINNNINGMYEPCMHCGSIWN